MRIGVRYPSDELGSLVALNKSESRATWCARWATDFVNTADFVQFRKHFYLGYIGSSIWSQLEKAESHQKALSVRSS